MAFLLLLGCFNATSDCAEADLFHVYAHPGGEFGGCTFESARDIKGVRCLGKPFATSLWPDGSVAYCYLDGAQTVAGIALPAESSVELYEDGSVGGWSISPNSAGPSATATYKGQTCTRAGFHANGQVASCVTFGAQGSKDSLSEDCWDEMGAEVEWRACRRRELDSPYLQWSARAKKTKR